MQITIKPEGDLTDFQAWDDFAVTMNGIVGLAVEHIILDMAEVSRMSSNYIGSIISSFKTAQDEGKNLCLINVQPKLFELMEMLKLNEIMKIERI